MYANHQINALISIDPDQAAKRILHALKRARMRKAAAAEMLGCTHGTMLRWIDRLGIQDRVDRLQQRAKDEGWHFERAPGSGRPKGSKDTVERVRRWKRAPKNPTFRSRIRVNPG